MENWLLVSQRLAWSIKRKLDHEPSLKKITQAAIAGVAGVSPTAAGYWFADTNGMNAEQARKLAEFLDVDAVWLETGEGSPTGLSQVAEPTRDVNSETSQKAGKGLKAMVLLGVISDDESQLLANFRQNDQRGKKRVMETASNGRLDDGRDGLVNDDKL